MSGGVLCGLVGRCAQINPARAPCSSSVAIANGELASAHLSGALARHEPPLSDPKGLETRFRYLLRVTSRHRQPQLLNGRQPSLTYRVTCSHAVHQQRLCYTRDKLDDLYFY